MMLKLSRSQFLKRSSRYVTGAYLLGLAACQSKSSSTESQDDKKEDAQMDETMTSAYAANLGLQLYTLRDQVADDKLGTLEKVANIGYKHIELYDPSTIAETAAMIKELGMSVTATHILPGFLTNNWITVPKPGDLTYEQILDSCAASGVSNVGVAVLFPEDRPTLGDYHKFAELANQAGEKAKSMGIQFYYHNHSFEFETMEGTTPFEVMTGAFDPDLVKLELDVFWTKVSGNDPIALIEKLGNQVLALHIKDLKGNTPQDLKMQVDPQAFLPVGEGVLDIKGILTAAHEAGVKYGFVEQDHHSEGDPFDNITTSYKYLQELGL